MKYGLCVKDMTLGFQRGKAGIRCSDRKSGVLFQLFSHSEADTGARMRINVHVTCSVVVHVEACSST